MFDQESVIRLIGIFSCTSEEDAGELVNSINETLRRSASIHFDSKWTPGWSVECAIDVEDSQTSKKECYQKFCQIAGSAHSVFLGWRHTDMRNRLH